MIGAIILFLGVAFLSVLNVDPVPVNFGFVEVEWPLIIIIFASVLLGALIATLLSTYKAFKDQRKSKHQTSDRTTRSDTDTSVKTTRSDKGEIDTSNGLDDSDSQTNDSDKS